MMYKKKKKDWKERKNFKQVFKMFSGEKKKLKKKKKNFLKRRII